MMSRVHFEDETENEYSEEEEEPTHPVPQSASQPAPQSSAEPEDTSLSSDSSGRESHIVVFRCCLPSDNIYGRNEATPIFSSIELTFPPEATGVFVTLN